MSDRATGTHAGTGRYYNAATGQHELWAGGKRLGACTTEWPPEAVAYWEHMLWRRWLTVALGAPPL